MVQDITGEKHMWTCLDQSWFVDIVICADAWGPILRGVPKIQVGLQMSCQQYLVCNF